MMGRLTLISIGVAAAAVVIVLRRRRPHARALLTRASSTITGLERYGAFVSHFKAEAAMEARFLQDKLQDALGKRVFLDSDDLVDLRLLTDAVLNSDVIVLLQSANVFTRPWCLLELVTAGGSLFSMMACAISSARRIFGDETVVSSLVGGFGRSASA